MMSKLQQRFKSEAHNVYKEEINKIELSSSHDKRLQKFDRITSYLYDTNAGKYAEQNRCNSLEHLTSFDDYTNENKTENNIK